MALLDDLAAGVVQNMRGPLAPPEDCDANGGICMAYECWNFECWSFTCADTFYCYTDNDCHQAFGCRVGGVHCIPGVQYTFYC